MNRYPDIQTSTFLECARALYPELTWTDEFEPRPSKDYRDIIKGVLPGVGDFILSSSGTGSSRRFQHRVIALDPDLVSDRHLIDHARDVERLRAYATASRDGESETDVALMGMAGRFIDRFPGEIVGTDGSRRVMSVIEEFERDDYREAFVRIAGPDGAVLIDIEIPPRKRRPFKILVTIGVPSTPE